MTPNSYVCDSLPYYPRLLGPQLFLIHYLGIRSSPHVIGTGKIHFRQCSKRESCSLLGHLNSTDVDVQLFGLSDRSIVDYVIASAGSSKSPEALFTSLQASGLPNTSEAHAFTRAIYSKVPRRFKHRDSARDSARRQAEKEAAQLKSKKFSFILDEDERTSAPYQGPPHSSRGKDSDKKQRRPRKRDTDGRDWESDEEEKVAKRKRASGPQSPSDTRNPESDPISDHGDDGMGGVEDEEALRERDRKERDAFAERVRKRDMEKTKKIVEDRSSRHIKGATAEEAEMRRLADDSAARQVALPSIRERSRQAYLTKREIQQIELLRKEITDDEALFRGMKITKREQRDLEYKKEVLRLAEARMKINDKWDGYQLPDDYFTEQGKIDKKKKESVMYQRYEENHDQKNFVTDVDQWEESQTRNSIVKTGAMDKPELVDDYEYVFDENQTIQFVLDQSLGGTMPMLSQKDALLKAQMEEAERRGRCPRSLPLGLVLTSDKNMASSEDNRRNKEIVACLSISGPSSQGHCGASGPNCSRRDRLGKNYATTPVSSRGRIYQRWTESRLHSTSSSCCDVRCCACC